MSFDKFSKKVLSNTQLYNIWYINNNNKLAFNLSINIYDIKYHNITLHIDGYFSDGPFRKPNVIWTKTHLNNHTTSYLTLWNKNNIYKPCPLSYQAGGEYCDTIGRWLDSTLVENTIENLFYGYILSKKYNVEYLIKDKWDELYYTRSYFTKNGNWCPSIFRKVDNVINYLEGEIKFFSIMKYNIYKELEFFKTKKNELSPIQRKFFYNNNVRVLLIIINYMSNISNFEILLFNKIFSFIEKDNIYKKLWNLDIFKWKMTYKDLKEHFLEFNKLKILNLFT